MALPSIPSLFQSCPYGDGCPAKTYNPSLVERETLPSRALTSMTQYTHILSEQGVLWMDDGGKDTDRGTVLHEG